MIRCVAIDDEQFALDVLVGYIKKIHYLDLVGSTTDPARGIEIIHEQRANLVFLDIQMDLMNGFELIKSIPRNTRVIFSTAYSEFAADSYEAEAIDYLLKPVSFDRFARAAQRAAKVIIGKTTETEIEVPNDYIYIKTEQKGKIIRINLDDIDYVEGMKNYVAFHRGKEKILAYLTMKDMEERLPRTRFMRVHKSYIVPLDRVIRLENSHLILKNRQDQVPLSDTYRAMFFERIGYRLLQ